MKMKKLITLMLAFVVLFSGVLALNTAKTYAASKFKRPGRVSLKNVGGADTAAVIRITPKRKNVKGYQIFRKDPGKGWKKVKTISQKKALILFPSGTAHIRWEDGDNDQIVEIVSKGLKSDTRYQYKVRAYNKKKIKGKVKYKYGKFSKVRTVKTTNLEYVRKKALKTVNYHMKYLKPDPYLNSLAQKHAEKFAKEKSVYLGRMVYSNSREIWQSLKEIDSFDYEDIYSHRNITSFGKSLDKKMDRDDFYVGNCNGRYNLAGIGYKDGYFILIVAGRKE